MQISILIIIILTFQSKVINILIMFVQINKIMAKKPVKKAAATKMAKPIKKGKK